MSHLIFNRRLSKKSQLTLAIIVGIIVLLLAVMIYYVMQYTARERIAAEQAIIEDFRKDTESIRVYLERCVRDTVYNGLVLLGQQGGYIHIPEIIRHTGNRSYWYLDQINIQPTLDEIRERMAGYTDENIPSCSNLELYRQRGIEIASGNVNSVVEFGTENVFVNITYPIIVKRGRLTQRFESFYEKYDIRFRRAYELASQIINRHFMPEFDVYRPLELVNNNVSLEVTFAGFNETDRVIIFKIRDRTRLEFGENYELWFASKFLNISSPSLLPSVYSLQDNSAFVPSITGFFAYSTDRLAQLNAVRGTMMNIHGANIDELRVTQSSLMTAARRNVPIRNDNGNIMYSDLVWNLKYPIYTYYPHGTRFNNPLRLILNWDEERNPNTGEVGILRDDGAGFKAIDSVPNYIYNRVWTILRGFSNYTIIDCGEQSEVSISVRAVGEAGVGAWFAGWVGGGYSLGEKCIPFTPSCDQYLSQPIITLDGAQGECNIISPSGYSETNLPLTSGGSNEPVNGSALSPPRRAPDLNASPIRISRAPDSSFSSSPFYVGTYAPSAGVSQGGKEHQLCAKVTSVDFSRRSYAGDGGIECRLSYR